MVQTAAVYNGTWKGFSSVQVSWQYIIRNYTALFMQLAISRFGISHQLQIFIWWDWWAREKGTSTQSLKFNSLLTEAPSPHQARRILTSIASGKSPWGRQHKMNCWSSVRSLFPFLIFAAGVVSAVLGLTTGKCLLWPCVDMYIESIIFTMTFHLQSLHCSNVAQSL